jgi:hypothetical protein
MLMMSTVGRAPVGMEEGWGMEAPAQQVANSRLALLVLE